MAAVTFDRMQKTYPDGTVAVRDLDLAVSDGELMVLVGPSGCGKTTALRMAAGLEEISSGQLRIGDRVVNHVPPRDRDIAMVFQSYALYPHMTVAENISFGLRISRLPKNEIDTRVRNAARILGLDTLLDRKPRALSGGQRQRVAMGRAIVREPSAFLMDEPLSNLDAKLRVQMRAEIAKLQGDLGVTTIYVTHDQVEAMTMGDRVAVMRKGELQQVADPQTLYDKPVNLFVGGFIGSPAMNMLEATLEERGDSYFVRIGTQSLLVSQDVIRARPGLARYRGRRVIIGIRPEDLHDAAKMPDLEGASTLRGVAELTEALGSEVLVHFTIDGRPAVSDDLLELGRNSGEDPAAEPTGDRRATLVGRFGPRARVRAGQELAVTVEARSLHFFDAESGVGVFA
jgi:multiple sugar transport system ATP-binding protein